MDTHRSRIRITTFLVALALGLIFSMFMKAYGADQALAPADLNRVKEGVAAPAFTLPGLDDKPVDLADYLGKKKIILVFYRGSW